MAVRRRRGRDGDRPGPGLRHPAGRHPDDQGRRAAPYPSGAARARRTSINTFLSSLAEDQGENAVGIILSGFGSDGALGIAAIKEHGGLTLSQAESTTTPRAGCRRAPRPAASSTTCSRSRRCRRHCWTTGTTARCSTPARVQTASARIFRAMWRRSARCCTPRLGRDFSQYKAGTLMRRIQRRMHVLQTDAVPAYIEQLRTLPHEAELLFRELLISVTRFFRDHEAFEALAAKVIPGWWGRTHDPSPIRVWVPGCATRRGGLFRSRSCCARAWPGPAAAARCRSSRPTSTTGRSRPRAPGSIGRDRRRLSAERLERELRQGDGNYPRRQGHPRDVRVFDP